eukprot:scaffold41092_cov250-Skeletonema_dohrnii-CCMP3373.AAC.1
MSLGWRSANHTTSKPDSRRFLITEPSSKKASDDSSMAFEMRLPESSPGNRSLLLDFLLLAGRPFLIPKWSSMSFLSCFIQDAP